MYSREFKNERGGNQGTVLMPAIASQDPLTVAVTALPVLRRMLQPARMVREWAQPRLLHLLNEVRDMGKDVLAFLVIVLVVAMLVLLHGDHDVLHLEVELRLAVAGRRHGTAEVPDAAV